MATVAEDGGASAGAGVADFSRRLPVAAETVARAAGQCVPESNGIENSIGVVIDEPLHRRRDFGTAGSAGGCFSDAE